MSTGAESLGTPSAIDHPKFPNPFPGLRPFGVDEHHLFFGREKQVTALLALLREHRLLAVVGSSGSGKSSLVRAGLIPALHRGTMTRAGSTWEVVVMRPGGDPVTNLARGLLDADLYDRQDPESLPRLKATLQRSHLGLVEAVRQSGALEPDVNLLIVVDQFEELFRFRARGIDSRQVAGDFVSLILAASDADAQRIYVALTMRSDYLGDCAQIQGLAQAVNLGEFLIPRLTRDQKREAIEKPIGVGGARIAARLTQLMLNDVGDDPDQLPILQHALMRTWDAWVANREGSEPLDLKHYESTGGMEEALSRHADEVFESLPRDHDRILCERVFRILTERSSDNRGIRRPTRLGELKRICDTTHDHLRSVIDPFRRPGVTFLMPGLERDVDERSVIDISHESLMRVWRRLRRWVEDEAQSARIFSRLTDTAALWKDDRAGLYHDPDLGIAQAWWEEQQPNEAWAEQYGGGFALAAEFLEKSRKAQAQEEHAKEEARQRELAQATALAETQTRAARNFKRFATSVTVLALAAIGLAIWAFNLWGEAEKNRQIADEKATEASRARHRTQELLVESRHDQGQLWLERAHRQLKDKEFLGAKLMAGKAIGFEGFGRAEADDTFREAQPVLLRPDSPEWKDAEELIRFAPECALIWSTPATPMGVDHVHPALNYDGTLLVWSDHSSTLTRWNTVTGEKLPAIECDENFDYVQFLSSGVLADTKLDGIVLHDLATPRVIRKFSSRDGELDPAGNWLLLRYEDRLRFLSPENGEPLGERIEVEGLRGEIAVSPDRRAIIAAHDERVRRFDVSSPKEARDIGHFSGNVTHALYSRNGKFVALFGNSGEGNPRSSTWMRVWNTASYEFLYEEDVDVGFREPLAFTGAEIGLHPGESFDSGTIVYDLEKRQPTGEELPGNVENVSGDGSTVALSTQVDIWLWDTETRRPKNWDPETPLGALMGARFRPDGKTFVTIRSDGLRLRDAATGKLRGKVLGPASFLEQSPDGRFLVTGERKEKTYRLWELTPGPSAAPHEIARFESLPTNVSFNVTGSEFAVALQDGRVLVIDVASATVVHRLEPRNPRPIRERPRAIRSTVAFHPNGTEVVVARAPARGRGDPGFDPESKFPLERWNLETDDVEIIEDDGCSGWVGFSPNGRWFAWSTESAIRVLDRDTGHKTSVEAESATVVFSPDGELLAVTGLDRGGVRLWELATREEFVRIPAGTVTTLDFAPDGRTLLTTSRDGTLKLWELGGRATTVSTPGFWRSLAVFPDGKTLMAATADRLGFFDTAEGRLLRQVEFDQELPTGERVGFRLNHDGTQFLTRPKYADHPERIFIRDVATGARLAELPHDRRAEGGVFDPAGECIVTMAGNKLYFWDAETFELISTVEEKETEAEELVFEAIDFSPDGTRVATADPEGVTLWDASSRTRRWRNAAAKGVKKLLFQPGKSEFLATLEPGVVRVWRISDQSEVGRFSAPAEAMFRAVFQVLDWSPDGSLLLCRGSHHSLLVWDLDRRKVIARLTPEAASADTAPAFQQAIADAAFTADGSRIAKIQVGKLVLWDYREPEDPTRYASYLDVFQFKQAEVSRSRSASVSAEESEAPHAEVWESGQLIPRPSDHLFKRTGYAMRPLASDTHIALLAQDRPQTEIDRALVAAYVAAKNWNAAAIILRAILGDDARGEKARFAEAIANEAMLLLESTGDETREGLVRQWLILADEFDPQNPAVAKVRSLLGSREEAR